MRVGLDIGSTTIKCVVLGEHDELLYSTYERHYSHILEKAQELLKLGWYLGFDGPVTYKNARRAPEVAAVTPLERIVVETDAPYMAPVPMRGKRNDSRYLPYVIEKLAEWKGVTAEEMTRVTWENGRRLFRI